MEMILKRVGNSLVPGDQINSDKLSDLKQNQYFKVKVTKPRNLAHHNKFYKLINLVFENQEYFESIESMLDYIKLSIGHYEVVTFPDGNCILKPKSISFSKMDQIEFNKFYQKALEICVEKIIKIDQQELELELLRSM